MKTYHIKDLLKKDLLIVEAKDEKIAWAIIFQKYGVKAVSDYTLLGSPDEIKEEDAKELVQYLTRRDLTITPKNYSKGKDGRFEDITFTESLLSALEKEILWENPYAEPDKFIDGFDNPCYEWWHEAESRTFDKKRVKMFVKN